MKKGDTINGHSSREFEREHTQGAERDGPRVGRADVVRVEAERERELRRRIQEPRRRAEKARAALPQSGMAIIFSDCQLQF